MQYIHQAIATATATYRLVEVIKAVSTWSKQWQRSVERKCLVPSCKRSVIVKEDARTIDVELISTDVSNC